MTIKDNRGAWPLPPGAKMLDAVEQKKLGDIVELKYDAVNEVGGVRFFRVRDGHGYAKDWREAQEVWYSEVGGVIVKDYGAGGAIASFTGWHVGTLYQLSGSAAAWAAAPGEVRRRLLRSLRKAHNAVTEVLIDMEKVSWP